MKIPNIVKMKNVVLLGCLTLSFLSLTSQVRGAERVVFSSSCENQDIVEQSFPLLRPENPGIFVGYQDGALVFETEPNNNGKGEARTDNAVLDEGEKPMVYSFNVQMQEGSVIHLTMGIRLEPGQDISMSGYGITCYRDGGQGLLAITRNPGTVVVLAEAKCNAFLSNEVNEVQVFVENTDEGVEFKVKVNDETIASAFDKGADSIAEGSGVAFVVHDNGGNQGLRVAITDVQVIEK